jgi:hypothetical protein
MRTIWQAATVLACVGGGAAVAQPRLEHADLRLTRVEPAFITPVWVVDGVEVLGERLPYNEFRSRVAGAKCVFDQYDGDVTSPEYVPRDNGGPCGAPPLLYAADADPTNPDHWRVRIANCVDDYKGMDSFAIGKPVTGAAFAWYQSVEEPLSVMFRMNDVFHEVGDGGVNRGGVQLSGVLMTYGGLIPTGLHFSRVDWTGVIVQPSITDTDGAVVLTFYNSTTLHGTANISTGVQIASWGAREDELPGPMSHRPHSGPESRWMYNDDAGALKVSPYVLANAVADGRYSYPGSQTGTTPDESYDTTSTACFSKTGPMIAIFVEDCQVPDACTLVAPADGAEGVANPPEFSFAPGAIPGVEYVCGIYKGGTRLRVVSGTATTFTLTSTLMAGGGASQLPARGQSFAWTMTAIAGGGCPPSETSPSFMFRLAGCAADYNGDFSSDFFDYLDFVDDFSSGRPMADFNADQAIDFFDYLDFVDAFSSGC